MSLSKADWTSWSGSQGRRRTPPQTAQLLKAWRLSPRMGETAVCGPWLWEQWHPSTAVPNKNLFAKGEEKPTTLFPFFICFLSRTVASHYLTPVHKGEGNVICFTPDRGEVAWALDWQKGDQLGIDSAAQHQLDWWLASCRLGIQWQFEMTLIKGVHEQVFKYRMA